MPGATAGVAYLESLTAANGTAPLTWSIESGTLPGGVSLASGTGELSGTATLAETAFIVVKVEDAVGDTATRALSLAVLHAAAAALTYDQQPGNIVAGVAFSPAIAVSVRDAFGNLVTDATDSVTLQLTSGSGSLVGTATVGASGGVASFPGLTIETAGTGKQVTATSGSLTDAVSTSFDVTPAAAAALAFVQQPGAVTAGVAITPAVTVRVGDAFGNGVSGELVALGLIGSGALTGGGAVATDGSGVATFASLSVDLAGSKQLSATSGALSPATSDPFTVNAAAAAALAYDQQPGNIAAGVAFSPAIAVSVRDAFGNLVTDATDSVTLQLTSGSGSLVGTTTVGASGGVASFPGLTIETAGTGKQVTASSGSLTSAVRTSFDVTPAAASSLAFVQHPGAVAVNATLTPAVTVRLSDSFGNVVPGEMVALSLIGTGTLVGGSAVATDGSGIATFAGLSVDEAGSKQLSATSGALTPATSDPFTVHGAASQLAFDQPPGNIVAGVAFSPAMVVSVRDALGNLVIDATDSVTLQLTSGSGSLLGTTTVNAVGGVASFPGLTIETAGTGKQVTATSGSLTSAVSASFEVTPAAATGLSYAQQPGTIVAGEAFSPAISVSALDAFGNLVTDFVGLVTLQLTTGSGSLVGTTSVTAGGGIADFPGLTIETAGTGKQVTATSGSLTNAVSTSFDVTPAAAASLAFVQQPSAVTAGVTMAPAVTVRVSDAFGNGVSGELVTLGLIGSGALTGGGAVATDGSGVATFASLSVDLAGSKQLSATSGVLTPATSDPFAVTSTSPASLSFVQQPSAVLAGATIAPAVTVRVVDAFANGVPGELVTLSLVGNGTLSGGGAVATDGSGLATFAGLGVNREGSKQLSATSGALVPATSDPFLVSCPVVAVDPATLPAGTNGTAYAQTIGASGGTAPWSFAVTAGALPPGLALDAFSGELSGTPSSAGSFEFTVTATDADSCLGSRAYTLLVCPVIAVLPASLPAASIGVAYSQTLTASAGSAPFTFAFTSGALPAGLSLSGAGAITGTPTAAGSFPFTVGVTAADGCTGSGAYTLDSFGTPAAVTDLAATRVTTGNDGDGTAKIQVTFTLPPGATVAETYRAPFGGYPRYDDAGGAVPAIPAYPPEAPWTLTGVTASGQVDEPSSRDFYYYVVFVRNAGGGLSPVSNRSNGACNYALGDVSDGVTAGAGNNTVGAEDISLLGANYGIEAELIDSRGVAYLDVGPTTNFLITSRPFTDRQIEFEDLIVFATNFGQVSSPALAMREADAAARQADRPERIYVEAPSLAEPGATVTAALRMRGAGRIQGFSATLRWDARVVEPLGTTSGGFVEGQGGVLLSPRAGTVDAALLGVRGAGLLGDGEVARVAFRVLRPGDPGIRLEAVSARDAANRPLPADAIDGSTLAAAPTRTLLLAPWPNPARGEATLAFALAQAGPVALELYSVDGRRVRTLVNGRREPGMYRVRWTGDDDEGRAVSPGIYYARLTVGGLRFTQKLVHLR